MLLNLRSIFTVYPHERRNANERTQSSAEGTGTVYIQVKTSETF